MSSAEIESIFVTVPRYIRESLDELKKVSRPTRQETIQATIVTIVIMMFMALVLFVFDVVFNRLMTAFLS